MMLEQQRLTIYPHYSQKNYLNNKLKLVRFFPVRVQIRVQEFLFFEVQI